MQKKDFIKELKKNKKIQISNSKKLLKIINKKKISLYCGLDPTNNSLHLGHLVPLIYLRKFQINGHKPYILIGGATSLIGDPSFQKSERKLINKNVIKKWTKKIKKQIPKFLKFKSLKNKAVIINNYNWFKSINILNFLRNIGKHFSIKQMIKKKTIINRIKNNSKKLSFTEFSYSLLQSYDFAYLKKKYNIILQIGGSDQWGNITSGIKLIKKLYKKKTYGITLPLITTKKGIKFGKTQLEQIWLSPKKTTPYSLYQFLIQTSNKNVYTFLKLLTFIKTKTLKKIIKQDKKTKNKIPQAQKILAETVTKLIHGKNELKKAKKITKYLFYGKIQQLKKKDLHQLSINGIPSISEKFTKNLQNILIKTKLITSKTKAKKLIQEKSISINGKKQINIYYIFQKKDLLHKKYTILQKGKKNFFLIKWKF